MAHQAAVEEASRTNIASGEFDLAFADRSYYTSQPLFEAEQDKVFARTWQFAGHASEVAEPGSFKRAKIAGQPLLVVRGEDGGIRAFFNTCRHRGAIVETRETGQCGGSFQCLYHHWRYDTLGQLRAVPMPDGYGDWFRREDYPLVQVPRCETFFGLIFVSLDPAAAPLEEFLGAMKPHLAKQYSTSGSPWEMLATYSYRFKANWKLFVENSVEGYHAPFLHHLAMRQLAGGFSIEGRALDLGIHGMIDWADTKENIEHDVRVQTHLLVFPNFLSLYHGERDVLAIRQVLPEAVGATTVRFYSLVRHDTPKEARDQVLSHFNLFWGPGGRNGADDALTMELMQEGLAAKVDAKVLVARGLDKSPVSDYYDEQPLRAFWRGWRKLMFSETNS